MAKNDTYLNEQNTVLDYNKNAHAEFMEMSENKNTIKMYNDEWIPIQCE